MNSSTDQLIPIQAIIFDLDNCLSAADEVGRDLLEAVFDAVRRANRGRLPESVINQACEDCWREPLDYVARKYKFPDDVLAAAWAVNKEVEVNTPMRGYDDVIELERMPVMRFLVTTGFRRLQESKIRALDLAHLFTRIFVDAIDEPDPSGKEPIFRRIMEEFSLQPRNVLVIGDNAASEIVAGTNLGLITIQILRPGVPPGNNATHQISTLRELTAMLISDGNGGALFSPNATSLQSHR